MCRESLRYISITWDHEIWLLSDSEVWFYNTFYAFVAIIMGISSAINFLIDKPTGLKRGRIIRTSILNDQRFLNWSFLAWISKLSFTIGILFIALEGYLEFNLLPEFKLLFILFAITLFLQIWTSIIRYIKVNKFKLLLYSGSAISILSFVLGSINLIDYRVLNESVLSKNIYHQYDLVKPKSNYWERNINQFKAGNLYMVNSKSKDDTPIILFNENEIDSLTQIYIAINNWAYRYPLNQKSRLVIQLNIDKKIEMRYVNDVKKQLAFSSISRIGYSVLPSTFEGNQRVFKNLVIQSRLYNYEYDPVPELIDSSIATIFEITQNQIKINEKVVSENQLYESIADETLETETFICILNYDETITYGQYLRVYSTIRELINNLRTQYALKEFNEKYEYLSMDEREIIYNKFPLIILDENYISRLD